VNGYLFDFAGRSRRPLISLARALGLRFVPDVAGGCALTEKSLAPRVLDLVDHDLTAGVRDLQLLTVGRHFRIGEETKLVLGRNAGENRALARLFDFASREKALLRLVPRNFRGPEALLSGRSSPDILARAVALLCHYVQPFTAGFARKTLGFYEQCKKTLP